MSTKKLLVALDFDHTIINGNSDTSIYRLSPDGKIPPELSVLYSTKGWTKYMSEVFSFLHNHGVKKKSLLDCVADIPLVKDMESLFKGLPREQTNFIIISDANSVFIDHIIKKKQLTSYIDSVFTNPAKFTSDELLTLQMYHEQDWCTLSTRNMCKGQILEDYVKLMESKGTQFHTIAYVGDGHNDFCPSKRLRECDAIFPRCNYVLQRTIEEHQKSNGKMTAPVHIWKTGEDILKVLENCLERSDNHVLPSPRLFHPEPEQTEDFFKLSD